MNKDKSVSERTQDEKRETNAASGNNASGVGLKRTERSDWHDRQ
jgi:hypothetical protein